MREAISLFALQPTLSGVLTVAAAAFAAYGLFRLLGFRLSIASRPRRAPAEGEALTTRPIGELKEAEEARERAEALSEEKSRRLATMSHEIRTPLNGILGMAELLAATPLDPEQNSYLEAIRSSGAALAALVDEVLDVAKIEAGKFELTRAPFDLVDLVEGVVELLAPQAQAKGLEIASAIDPCLSARRVGDAARLRQVLINLTGNAVKFTTKGGVGLRVCPSDGTIEFAVVDTGPGIPPQSRDAIFEEFAVGDAGAQTPAASAGLGLSISRRLVEHMGGSLRLGTTSPSGSTFVLRLPLPPAAGASPIPVPDELRGKSALIVAGSRFEAPYLAEKLRAAGIEVRWAASEEASRVFLRDTISVERAPDIAIVDCALGMEATQALGTAARAAGVKRSFVFFSPSERRAFEQKALQAFDGWLVKPLRTRSLYARLAAPRPQANGERLTPANEEARLTHLEILVAEDNDINALITVRHLQRAGAHVLRVNDGVAALDAAKDGIAGRRAHFDAIILDIRMPGLDGIEAARCIRQAERAAGVAPCRLIALSADAFESARSAARAAGIDEFLTKPVDLARLDRALTGHAAASEPEQV